ncbi:glycosyltransferase family A protein [Methylocapsa sp. S129]|uniref:glycosyltransferase family A protein n=1 Tax=Methylocapsa sp. S129 TaxID=1641869 RepID=UPI00131C82D5|nr:glycosyltransferase family A protein [Methylocapsa sp. S129]
MKKLSVIVVSYNMTRELPRTIRSLSPSMQRDIAAEDYEVIVVDNGSVHPFDEAECRRWIPDLIVHHIEHPTQSPVPAINKGLAMARGEIVGVFIDGARMASPGMLAAARLAFRLHERPVVGTLAFHLGPKVQMDSVKNGYNQAVEDELLKSSKWEEDSYRLFEISAFAGSSDRGWFDLPAEANALFLKAGHWREIGGYDAAFVTPGGGLANLDIWERLCADPSSCVIMLLGEATFHQVHGGVATNSLNPPQALFAEEYHRIRGHGYVRPNRQAIFLGSAPRAVLASIELSAAMARAHVRSE